jgi:hypothetical protein
MSITIDLNQLYENNFGTRPKADQIEVDGNDSRLVNVRSGEKYFKAAPDDLYGRSVFMPITLGGVFLPYTWLTISGSKKIVQTDLTERRGYVKEFIRENDLQINIKGFVFNADGTFPEQQVEALNALFAINAAIAIDCPFTDIFLLTNENGAQDSIVIKSFKFLDDKGVEHVKSFEIELVTDQDFELEIL